MDKNWLLNTQTFSQRALGTWELLFLTLKCDLRKNPKSKVSKKQKKKRCFVTPPSTTLTFRELATIVTKDEGHNFFLSSRFDQ
jgi:hypothetical protein